MTNSEKKIVAVAILKGVAHAIVVPMFVMLITNYIFSGNWGFIAGLTYLLIPSTIYYFIVDKNISKIFFIYTLSGIFFFMILYVFIILTLIY